MLKIKTLLLIFISSSFSFAQNCTCESNTLLLRIPSFNGTLKKDIDSVTAANQSKIESTETLIIDIRNNGGSSDNSFAKIIPYLYTNPIRSRTMKVL
ncbi:S41 family peptidase [Chryseobacterium sp.]|uniref:S41 family peptidase n=1 Tax=Chryseobacterium sp. TaxID=1871047 RepID=UPI0025C5E46C|nr:S41 family peptidase [Chryseobacterium sp.]